MDTQAMGALAPESRSLTRRVSAPFRDRSFRVIALITLIVVMSVIDLYLTLLYITHTGMTEANPLARAMMEYQSPTILALWKAATVVLGVGILAFIRKKRSAELGAWIGCLILGFLMSHWVNFIHEHASLSDGPIMIEAMGDPNWVHMNADLLGPTIAIP
ncbi:MAG: hypothetical protein JJ974_00030 [Phycisphaerales bacterium]|nr:hypothetical protein [Phycisphaerales bacterium]